MTTIIYTSVVKPLANAQFAASPGHFHTELLIRESGIPYTFQYRPTVSLKDFLAKTLT